jgi:hypothetical protein
MKPKLIGSQVQGSRFKPALARRDVATRLFSLYMNLVLHHHILTCQVWAKGSKVTTDGPATTLIKIRNTRLTPLGETAF